MNKILFSLSFFFIFVLYCSAIETGIVTGLPIPRYVSLRGDNAKLRVGPGKQYKTSYLYECKNYPVKVIAEFDNWRKIEDIEKTQGWMHRSLLSGINYAIVQDNKLASRKNLAYKIAHDQTLIFQSPDENSKPIAKLEFNVIVKIMQCQKEWCKINVKNFAGWIRKVNLWGVNDH